MAAFYSRVDRGVWNSADVRALSKGAPGARELWLYLLTCPTHTGFPGLFVASIGAIADDLEWEKADVQRCIDEIVARGMARFDPATRLFWLPKALARRRDEAKSDKSVKSWRDAWDGAPACAIRDAAFDAAVEIVQAGGSRAALSVLGTRDASASQVSPADALPVSQVSPADAGEERRGEKRKGEDARRAEPARPRTEPLTDQEQAARDALEADRDLYPSPHVSNADVDAAARRMATAMSMEPKAKDDSIASLVSEATSMARTHKAKYAAATPEQVLAKVEEAFKRYVIGDIHRDARRKQEPRRAERATYGPRTGEEGRQLDAEFVDDALARRARNLGEVSA